MIEGKHMIIHIWKMYISIIYAWERKGIRPVSKWPSPRNLTSWNSPFSFISEGSFGRRRSRARSLIRPGFAIMICVKMHQKKNENTLSASPSSRSPPLCPLSSRRTWQGRLETRQVTIEKSPKNKEEEKDFWKLVQKSKAKLPLQCQDRCSSERPLQGIQTGQRCFFWANKYS